MKGFLIFVAGVLLGATLGISQRGAVPPCNVVEGYGWSAKKRECTPAERAGREARK
jgi:hypothetical protein